MHKLAFFLYKQRHIIYSYSYTIIYFIQRTKNQIDNLISEIEKQNEERDAFYKEKFENGEITESEYKTAYNNGKISVGALVIIIDETEINSSETSPILGKAVLGKMILE